MRATGTPLSAQQSSISSPTSGLTAVQILSQSNASSRLTGKQSSPAETSRFHGTRPSSLCHVLHETGMSDHPVRPQLELPLPWNWERGWEAPSLPMDESSGGGRDGARNIIILFFSSSSERGCVGNIQRTHPSCITPAFVWSFVPAAVASCLCSDHPDHAGGIESVRST